jgi:hypothetical protein
MKNARSAVTGAAFLFCYILVRICCAQQENCAGPCGRPTAWQDFNNFTLKMTTPGNSGYSLWQGRFDKETNDIQVNVETSENGRVARGKILMIGGRIMAVQGPIVEPGYEIDAMDAPVLELQLVVKLLGRVLQDGPSSVRSPQVIDYTDGKTGIKIATPSADGMIQPPWHVVGEVKPAQGNAIEYTLTLTSKTGDQGAKARPDTIVSLGGSLSNIGGTKIDDRLSLESWNLFGVGVQSRKEGSSTTYDYSAAPATTNYKTVSDVRKKLAEQDYPGEADPSKNFTGFWETDCDNGFGLQIMPHGSDGKYSVVFCGPGGCGNPDSEGRKTFITKDSHYHVINDDELKIQGGDGWETYHRCTKDTHPVLKYKQP